MLVNNFLVVMLVLMSLVAFTRLHLFTTHTITLNMISFKHFILMITSINNTKTLGLMLIPSIFMTTTLDIAPWKIQMAVILLHLK